MRACVTVSSVIVFPVAPQPACSLRRVFDQQEENNTQQYGKRRRRRSSAVTLSNDMRVRHLHLRATLTGYDVYVRMCSSYQGSAFEKDAVQHPTCTCLAFNVRGTAAPKSQRRKGNEEMTSQSASHLVDAREREIRHRRLPGCSAKGAARARDRSAGH